ncbi:MAG: extracellular solute-binding protein, partial [Acidobacteriota bacterium]
MSVLVLIASLMLLLIACAPAQQEGETSSVADDPTNEAAASTVVVYSGRNASLIGPLLERFEAKTNWTVEVRYGGTAELAATLMEEVNTPCELFISQDAGALGALAKAGKLLPLDDAIVQRIPDGFRDTVSANDETRWVGLSGRARVVVYNADQITPEALPTSLADVADARYKGRFGVAPANGSFQAHMAAYRAEAGAEALDALLTGLTANDPQRYPKNSAIVEATIS